ncbi:hypothetical protein QR680_011489 [Steinernema hermaphroditum]|uniref:ABC transporter domain-containing protein n=1 Tax=Steinernema hermaphroditum TaxID=289476 RepID=A0AA39HYN7_9BILA|nr:hypothetical protein QR680_011489 [Steinernema hermaphroditum]
MASAAKKEKIAAYLKNTFPDIPYEIDYYITAVATDPTNHFPSKEKVIEAFGPHLKANLEHVCNEAVHNVCEKLFEIIHDGKVKKTVDNGDRARKLEQTVDIRAKSYMYENMDSIWALSTKDTPLTTVDKGKLQKAEERAKFKSDKRGAEEAGQPKKKKNGVGMQATASCASSRRAEVTGNMDIMFDNIDMSIGTRQLLNGANVAIVYGRRYGLVGRNGIGKTTLLKMIACGQLPVPSNISMLAVEQEVEGDDTLVVDSVLACDTRREDMLRREKEIQDALNNSALPEAEHNALSEELSKLFVEMETHEVAKAPARAAGILYGLGFTPEEQKRPTKEFSGGWRMRVALARALFMKPDLLLLDEPTNMLDMRAIYWLENHLQDWASTIIIVSHDRSFLNAICTDIVHLHSRRLDQYRGNYDTYEKTMHEKLTQQQREYEAQQQLRQHTQEFIDKFRYNAKRASMVQSRIKMLERLPVLKPVEYEADVVLHFPDCEVLQNPVLQLDEANFQYTPDSPLLFHRVCIGSDATSRVCIVGENGAGKTTLLKLLLGDLEPTSGYRNSNRRLKIGYFTQHHVDQLDMDMSAVEVLQKRFPNKDIEEYRAALGRFGLTGDLALQSVVTLSGGQKSRLAFAILGMLQPNYLIMDEPTNHLDVETVDALGHALNKFKGGVVLVSHDERLISLVCKELWVVKDRTVTILEGGLEEYKKHVYRQLAL